jgi:small subunit ribosomal protein S9
MTEGPQQPEQPEAAGPEDEAPGGVPGEPGETTPSEPDGGEEVTPEAGTDEPAEDVAAEAGADAPAGDAETEGAEAGGDEAAEGGAPAAEPGADTEGGAPAPEEAAEGGAPGPEEAAEAGADEAAEGGAPGPEIEGVEELAEAARPEAAPREERPRPGRRRRRDDEPTEEVIPGAHLEPDLVLEEQAAQEETEYGQYGEYVEAEAAIEEPEPTEEAPPEPEPVARKPLDLAADARYQATGKRKSAVARVTLKPGEGTYSINGRHLDEYFPRVLLQRMAQQPLEAAGYQTRMDVVARIHGGGMSAQATALRHGVARALVEADPALRGELKRRGYLTRDPRVKERKKAGLKKARKRPQFSKR